MGLNENDPKVIERVQVSGEVYEIAGGGVGSGMPNLTETTYAALKSLRDNGKLVPGTKYRITDYVTTTTQSETKSAGNQFDIIVEALTEDSLSELASACLHEGDTYFSSQGCNLEAWQLWYDLDNDTEKYEWADTENGKGVIYRMIDEKRNDCPYDFKNILFHATNYTSDTTSDKYYYTFAYVLNRVLYDGTVKSDVQGCYGNVMKPYYSSQGVQSLNRNIFKNTLNVRSCYSNTFGDNCYRNTFGDKCYSNTFGNDCYGNIFGDFCYDNTFGNGCYSNEFENGCYSNEFENGCYYNTFGGNCYSNTFGDNCYRNTFGNKCYSNTFGNDCENNTFRENTNDRKLDSKHTSITLNEEYYDDGVNALVPIKHPDLSTQPSILPYKFMGQYVYEQLIPTSELLVNSDGDAYLPTSLIGGDFILDCRVIGTYGVAPIYLFKAKTGWYLHHDMFGGGGFKQFNYIKVIYTSMPEEGGDYYYNLQVKKGILIKFNSLDVTPGSLYDGSTRIEPVALDQGYHYDIPDDYGQRGGIAAFSIESLLETLTVRYFIPNIGETGALEYNNFKMIELPAELVGKAKQYLVIIMIA